MHDMERKNLTTIFEAMVDGVYIVDDDFNIEHMNDEMIKHFGRGIGRKCFQVIHGRDEVCSWCRGKGGVSWGKYSMGTLLSKLGSNI